MLILLLPLMIRLDLLIKKKKKKKGKGKKKKKKKAALTLPWAGMSEGKSIILLNSCGVGERRQTFKAAWRLVFVISLLLFLIPGPEIYGLISASNFSTSSFFFPNGDNLNTPHRQRELFFLSLSLSFSLPALPPCLFICFSHSRCVCSGLFFCLFLLFFHPRFSPAFCIIVDIIHLSKRIYCTSTGLLMQFNLLSLENTRHNHWFFSFTCWIF